jgi:metal-responsive CopG/Arc/MetJ family transcriptional regulator
MKRDSLEYRVRRKSELSEFMGAKVDDLIEEEARQSRARVAAEVIGSYVARARHSAGDIQRLAVDLKG